MTDYGIEWHAHHDQLAERLTERRENRIAYIDSNKPEHERPTRLRLMHPLTEQAVKVFEAWEEALRIATAVWDEAMRRADAAWNEAMRRADAAWYEAKRRADAAWNEAKRRADAARNEAMRVATQALEAIHRIECPDCPWDGRTIFPDDKP